MSFVTLLEPVFTAQIELVKGSKATARGLVPTVYVPKIAPVDALILVTEFAVAPEFATQIELVKESKARPRATLFTPTRVDVLTVGGVIGMTVLESERLAPAPEPETAAEALVPFAKPPP